MNKGPNELQIATSCGQTSGQGYRRLVPVDTWSNVLVLREPLNQTKVNAAFFASHKLWLQFWQWLTELAQRHEWHRAVVLHAPFLGRLCPGQVINQVANMRNCCQVL